MISTNHFGHFKSILVVLGPWVGNHWLWLTDFDCVFQLIIKLISDCWLLIAQKYLLFWMEHMYPLSCLQSTSFHFKSPVLISTHCSESELGSFVSHLVKFSGDPSAQANWPPAKYQGETTCTLSYPNLVYHRKVADLCQKYW